MSEKKRVFISYSRKDYWDEHNVVIPDSIVLQVKKALEAKGIKHWFDDNNVHHENVFLDQISEAIETVDVFLFISTENSNKSPWVRKELDYALKKEKHIMILKAVKDYPGPIEIRIGGYDYEDYYQKRTAAINKLIEKVVKELTLINTTGTNAEALAAELERLNECLSQLNLEIEKLEEEQKTLAKNHFLKMTSRRLIDVRKEEVENMLIGLKAIKKDLENEKVEPVVEPEVETLPSIEPSRNVEALKEETVLPNNQKLEHEVEEDDPEAVSQSEVRTTKGSSDYGFLCGHMNILKTGKAESENS